MQGMGILAQNAGNVTITHNEVGVFRQTGIPIGWIWGYIPSVMHDIETSFNYILDIGMHGLSFEYGVCVHSRPSAWQHCAPQPVH